MLNCLWFHMLGNRKATIQRPPTPTLQELVDTKLVGSGEKERLKAVLRERLVECGWRDEMKPLCSEFARKKGRDNVTVDELVNVITLKGRASVPDSVKAEMLQRIRSFLASTST